MLEALREALYHAVGKTVPETRIAVAFSGGIDSSLLARVCTDLGKETTLITVGFADSHDIRFSKKIAEMLRLEHNLVEINSESFERDLAHIRKTIACDNTSHIENCVAYLNIAKAASAVGTNLVLSANGCDELFCGYSAYRTAYGGGADSLMKLMEEKISNELVLVQEISQVMRDYCVEVRQPFLSQEFISFAKTIPIQYKIRGTDDMMRKHILRQVALMIGVPKESAMKPKKALQYGSLIHKNFRKTMMNKHGA